MEDNDLSFYEDAVEDVKQEERGITDRVTEYTYTKLEYPCIIFREGFSAPMHKLAVVSNMVKSNARDKDISLYMRKGDDIYKLGMLAGCQIEAFLDIIGTDSVIGHLDENIKLEGNNLYTLYSFI